MTLESCILAHAEATAAMVKANARYDQAKSHHAVVLQRLKNAENAVARMMHYECPMGGCVSCVFILDNNR